MKKKRLNYLLNLKIKKDNHCPTCNLYTKFYFIKSKKRFYTNCNHSIYLTKNKIYYKSFIPLKTWFQIILMFFIFKNIIFAKELERMLRITYNINWRMANKIRNLMTNKVNVINEIVKMDNTYIIRKEIDKHKNKKSLNGFVNKVPVFEMKSHNYKIFANTNNNKKKKTLYKNIYKHIGMNILIITNKLFIYKNIRRKSYWKHQNINDAKREYGKQETINNFKISISINWIENFWSVFKQWVKVTYIRLNKKWIQSYIHEFVFRQNNEEKVLFRKIMERI